jgi:hypothetical protein
VGCSLERVERIYTARLAFIAWRYPRWQIGREQHVWTATRRPTPTALHFIYAESLDQLERALSRADIPPGDAAS